jgi:hypothetical protein
MFMAAKIGLASSRRRAHAAGCIDPIGPHEASETANYVEPEEACHNRTLPSIARAGGSVIRFDL